MEARPDDHSNEVSEYIASGGFLDKKSNIPFVKNNSSP